MVKLYLLEQYQYRKRASGLTVATPVSYIYCLNPKQHDYIIDSKSEASRVIIYQLQTSKSRDCSYNLKYLKNMTQKKLNFEFEKQNIKKNIESLVELNFAEFLLHEEPKRNRFRLKSEFIIGSPQGTVLFAFLDRYYQYKFEKFQESLKK